MPTNIQLKRSLISGQIPGSANVLVGEPAVNLADRIIYSKDGTGNVVVIGAGTTSNILEGVNLYFTDIRARAAFSAGTNITIEDGVISSTGTANANVNFSVAGARGDISNAQLAAGITTSGLLKTANIIELTNLYFTNARSRAAISIASSNATGKGSYNNTTGVFSIDAANVTVSLSAPANPYIGDKWIEAGNAIVYLFVNDGTSHQWVEF
jgi:hypothetical protein